MRKGSKQRLKRVVTSVYHLCHVNGGEFSIGEQLRLHRVSTDIGAALQRVGFIQRNGTAFAWLLDGPPKESDFDNLFIFVDKHRQEGRVRARAKKEAASLNPVSAPPVVPEIPTDATALAEELARLASSVERLAAAMQSICLELGVPVPDVGMGVAVVEKAKIPAPPPPRVEAKPIVRVTK